MIQRCSKCGTAKESAWKFCPHCGSAGDSAIPDEPGQASFEPEQAEKAPVQGAFGGLLFGMLAVPMMVIVGTMLCLTGLGAVLGIPMIVAAVFAPLIGPMIGMGVLRGKCPWCGIAVSSVANARDFACHGCGKRISIRHRAFVAAS